MSSRDEAFLKLIEGYENHLKILGCRHIRVPLKQSKDKSQSTTKEYGQWIIGPNGTFIFAYIESFWPQTVVLQVMNEFIAALQYPNKISKYM